MPSSRIIFLPLSRRGMGSGHLRRCFETARSIQAPVSIVFDDTQSDALLPDDWKNVLPDFPGLIPFLLTSKALSDDTFFQSSATLAVFDRRSSSEDDILPWAAISTPVLLDDNGPARILAPFVLDTIPGPRGSDANEASPSWMNLPPRRRNPDPGGMILLSFGGEDPAGITLTVLNYLMDFGIEAGRIHLTEPSGFQKETLPDDVTVLDAPERLKDLLGDYGMVICSYGFTAWEALAAGCAVITADPSEYHARLSTTAGFPGLGCMAGGSRRSVQKIRNKLRNLLEFPESLCKSVERIAQKEDFSSELTLSTLLESLEAPEPRCTACGEILPLVIARFPRRSYYRCPDCGIIGLYRFERSSRDEYGSDYFQSEYKNQYGKSYLEDFSAIKSMGAARMNIICGLGKKGGSLLDIGCAFGPFLEAAREAGYQVFGTDISEEAASYVRETLKIPAVSGAFPGMNPAEAFKLKVFDVITLWYVIEHFPDLKMVLEALNTLLPINGVLAMSTPNAAGISARRSIHNFLKKSPGDHYSIWTPRTARKLLLRYGFKVYKIRISGHHPERFGFFPKLRAILNLLGFISRIFSLGDTFEIYAVKERSLV